MAITGEWIRYGGGVQPGFFSKPAGARGPLPGILVLQEAWGVDAHLEDVTRRYAAAGYAALAPDLYAPGGERPPELGRERIAQARAVLDALPPASWGDQKARDAAVAAQPEPERSQIAQTLQAAFGGLQLPRYLPQLLAASKYLLEECEATRGQKVGSVGYCLGGGLSALLACHEPRLSAAVVYYGMSPPAEAIAGVQCPILAFYGATDARFTATAAPFAEAMQRAGKRFEHQIYEGAGHAFNNDGRPSYHAGAARDAFARAIAFFRAELA